MQGKYKYYGAGSIAVGHKIVMVGHKRRVTEVWKWGGDRESDSSIGVRN